MSDRLDSILNDIKQYANDAYDDGWAGGYDEGWDSFGESHTDTLVRKGEDNICKEFLEEFSGNCLVFTPQTPQQLQEFIKTYDNGLLAAAATINFMRAWMEEREIV